MSVQFFKGVKNTDITIINSKTELNIDGFTKLVPNITDKGGEKHLPTFRVMDDKVEVAVGEILHPMEEDHFINFIYLETNIGGQVKYLKPNCEPKATFILASGEIPTAIYEYCNLHGLWKVEV